MTNDKRARWGTWFRQALSDAGYKSQQEFAQATRFARVQVQRWASGAVQPKEENMAAIAAALKTIASEDEVYAAAGYPCPGATFNALPETLRQYKDLNSVFALLTPEETESVVQVARVFAESKKMSKIVDLPSNCLHYDPDHNVWYDNTAELIEDRLAVREITSKIVRRCTQEATSERIRSNEAFTQESGADLAEQ